MRVFNIDRRDDCSVSLQIEVSGEEWEKYLISASQDFQSHAEISGWRTGKAPLGVAINHFGEQLLDKAAVSAMPELFAEACIENNFAPITMPDFMILSESKDSMDFLANFVNYPEIKELNYKGIVIEKPVKVCDQAELDVFVDEHMRQHMYVHEVERPAQIKDIVEITFTGTCAGERFEYDHSEKCRFLMGTDEVFAGLDEALVGHVKGDRLQLSLTMPESFHRESVAGKTLDLTVTLKSVCARDLLECTDDYVRENIKGCDTVEQFREQHRQKRQKKYDEFSDELFEKRADKALADTVTCIIPDAMVQVVINRYLQRLHVIARQEGKTAEQLLAEEGKTMKTFIEACHPIAHQQARQAVALDYIIQKEAFTVSKEEVNEYLAGVAKRTKIDIETAKARLGGEEAIVEKMLHEKAMELVVSMATINEVIVKEFPKE